MERILCQKTSDVDLAHNILSWILHALRPLAVEEIQHALATELGQKELDRECLIDKEDIVSVCAGLVTIDQERNIIHFVHQTVREYLQSIRRDQFPTAQESITRTCLTYLCFDVFTTQTQPDPNDVALLWIQYPLLCYAAENWGHHAREAPEHNIAGLILDFLDHMPQTAYFVMHSSTFQYGGEAHGRYMRLPRCKLQHLLVYKQRSKLFSKMERTLTRELVISGLH